ncbi:MAG: hypothetical protein KDJ52_20250 [Anaerolineae bacterium]|nr:hypothetical protein [Anaerolineae bacterium]
MQQNYDLKITPWHINERDYPSYGSLVDKEKFLLQYAILAPSKYNIQPWRFAINEDEVQFWLDPSCWLTASDPNRRELHISIGAALENFLIAAEHFGFGHTVTYFPEADQPEFIASVLLSPNGSPSPFRKDKKMFYAIINRHTSRNAYEALTIPKTDLSQIENCCAEPNIKLHLTNDLRLKKQVDALMIQADALQFASPSFREELTYWLKEGAFSASWLVTKMGRLATAYLGQDKLSPASEQKVLNYAPFLAILSSMEDNRKAYVATGQAFERTALIASSLGVQLQPMTQIIEVPQCREALKSLVPIASGFPQHIFRLGYGSREKSHTPRHALNEVLL